MVDSHSLQNPLKLVTFEAHGTPKWSTQTHQNGSKQPSVFLKGVGGMAKPLNILSSAQSEMHPELKRRVERLQITVSVSLMPNAPKSPRFSQVLGAQANANIGNTSSNFQQIHTEKRFHIFPELS